MAKEELQQGLTSDGKRCLDAKIGPLPDLKSIRDGFDSAVQACSLSAEQRSEYLAYTNVLAGVVPDSVGDDALSELKAVIDLRSYRRGTVQELFTNGWVVVKWDGDTSVTPVKQSEIAAEVRSRGGVAKGVDVMNVRTGARSTASEVFANEVALVSSPASSGDSGVESIEHVPDLSPRVDCLSLCTLADVIDNTSLRRGYLTAIFANGMATVRWDGDAEDSNVNLSEVSGRVQ